MAGPRGRRLRCLRRTVNALGRQRLSLCFLPHHGGTPPPSSPRAAGTTSHIRMPGSARQVVVLLSSPQGDGERGPHPRGPCSDAPRRQQRPTLTAGWALPWDPALGRSLGPPDRPGPRPTDGRVSRCPLTARPLLPDRKPAEANNAPVSRPDPHCCPHQAGFQSRPRPRGSGQGH